GMDGSDICQVGFRFRAQGGGQDVIFGQGAVQRIGDGGGLLVNFLEHVMAVFALVHAEGGVFVAQHGVLDRFVALVPYLAAFYRQAGVVALFQIDELIGDLQQGQRVGGDELLFAGFADDEWAAHAGAVERVGLVLVDHAQGVGAVQFSQGGTESAQQVGLFLVVVGQQVGDHFGVGFRGEGVAEVGELLAQCTVVFDDAVMDDGQAFREMGVCVAFGGFAVGGPAGVGDAQVAVDGFLFQGVFQFDDLAHGAGAFDAVAGGQYGDAGRVVAAVFQAAEAFDEDGGDVAFGDGAYYSAHGGVPACLFCVQARYRHRIYCLFPENLQ